MTAKVWIIKVPCDHPGCDAVAEIVWNDFSLARWGTVLLDGSVNVPNGWQAVADDADTSDDGTVRCPEHHLNPNTWRRRDSV